MENTLHGEFIIFYTVTFIQTNFCTVAWFCCWVLLLDFVFFFNHCCTQICVCSNQGSPSHSQHYILLCQQSACGRTWADPAHNTFLSRPKLPFLRGDTVWRALPHQIWQHTTPGTLPGTCSIHCSHPTSPGRWRHLSSFTHAEHSTDSYATVTANQPGWKWEKGLPAEKGGYHPLKAFWSFGHNPWSSGWSITLCWGRRWHIRAAISTSKNCLRSFMNHCRKASSCMSKFFCT